MCVCLCSLSYESVPPPLGAKALVNILSTLGQRTTQQCVPEDPCPACLYPLIWTEGNQADPVNNTERGHGKPQRLLDAFVSGHQGHRGLSSDCRVGNQPNGGTIKMIKDAG